MAFRENIWIFWGNARFLGKCLFWGEACILGQETYGILGKKHCFRGGSLAFWEGNTAFGGQHGFFKEQHGFFRGKLCSLPALREPPGPPSPRTPEPGRGFPLPEGATPTPWALPSAATPKTL